MLRMHADAVHIVTAQTHQLLHIGRRGRERHVPNHILAHSGIHGRLLELPDGPRAAYVCRHFTIRHQTLRFVESSRGGIILNQTYRRGLIHNAVQIVVRASL